MLQGIAFVHHLVGGKKGEIDTPFPFLEDKPPAPDSLPNQFQFLPDEGIQPLGHHTPHALHLGRDEEARSIHPCYVFPNLLFHQ